VESHFASILDLIDFCIHFISPTAGTFVVILKVASKVPPESSSAMYDGLKKLADDLERARPYTEHARLRISRWQLLVSAFSSALSSGWGLIEHAPRKDLALKMSELRLEPRWPSRFLLAINWAMESSADLPELVARLISLPSLNVVAPEDDLLDSLATKGFSRELAFTFQHVSAVGKNISAKEYLSRMEQARIQPTMYSFSLLMRRALVENNITSAIVLFDQMVELKIEAKGTVDQDGYRTLLSIVTTNQF
jgi:hypothetical protein